MSKLNEIETNINNINDELDDKSLNKSDIEEILEKIHPIMDSLQTTLNSMNQHVANASSDDPKIKYYKSSITRIESLMNKASEVISLGEDLIDLKDDSIDNERISLPEPDTSITILNEIETNINRIGNELDDEDLEKGDIAEILEKIHPIMNSLQMNLNTMKQYVANITPDHPKIQEYRHYIIHVESLMSHASRVNSLGEDLILIIDNSKGNKNTIKKQFESMINLYKNSTDIYEIEKELDDEGLIISDIAKLLDRIQLKKNSLQSYLDTINQSETNAHLTPYQKNYITRIESIIGYASRLISLGEEMINSKKIKLFTPTTHPKSVLIDSIVLPKEEELIAESKYTYKVLSDALKRTPGTTVKEDCSEVHNAFRNLQNHGLGIAILRDFKLYSPDPIVSLLKNKVDDQHEPTPEEVNEIEQYLMDSLNEYLSRSHTVAFTDEKKRVDMINGIIQGFHSFFIDILDTNTSLSLTGYVAFIYVLNFINSHSISFQTLWAQDFVTECIEAYDSTIDTYKLGEQISCPGGIIERAFMAISNVLSPGYSVVLTADQLVEEEKIRRKKMFMTWLREYYNGLKEDSPFTIEGLRNFILTKIPDDSDKSMDKWMAELEPFLLEDINVKIFLGGKRRRKTRRKQPITRRRTQNPPITRRRTQKPPITRRRRTQKHSTSRKRPSKK